jgi:hypothetical protein
MLQAQSSRFARPCPPKPPQSLPAIDRRPEVLRRAGPFRRGFGLQGSHEKPAFEVVAGKALKAAEIERELAELEGLKAAYGRLALVESQFALAGMLLRSRS